MNGNHKPLGKNTVYNWFSRYTQCYEEHAENRYFPRVKNTANTSAYAFNNSPTHQSDTALASQFMRPVED
jgi:hypothetical protein